MKWSNVSKKAHKWSNFRIHQQHMVCENTVKLVQKNTGGPFIHSHNSTYTYTCWLKLHTTPSQLPKCPNLSTLQRPCQGGQQCFKLAVFGYLTQPCSHRRDCCLQFWVQERQNLLVEGLDRLLLSWATGNSTRTTNDDLSASRRYCTVPLIVFTSFWLMYSPRPSLDTSGLCRNISWIRASGTPGAGWTILHSFRKIKS